MDNMLIQISGRKRVVLFSPRDALFLYLNGQSCVPFSLSSLLGSLCVELCTNHVCRILVITLNEISFVGDKSEVMDIDNPDLVKYPEFPKATRHEGILEPGDILFIPGQLNDDVTQSETR